MSFYDDDHQQRIRLLEEMWERLNDVEDIAVDYDIGDIAQDNNLKLLQTLVLFDFKNQSGREGSDAIDRYGNEWELKTANMNLVSGFSTNHHTTHDRIEAFRRERWMFSIYAGIRLVEVYVMSPAALEPFFSKWERSIAERAANGEVHAHLNNPKIPIKFVREAGIRVYPFSVLEQPLDPAEILKDSITGTVAGALF